MRQIKLDTPNAFQMRQRMPDNIARSIARFRTCGWSSDGDERTSAVPDLSLLEIDVDDVLDEPVDAELQVVSLRLQHHQPAGGIQQLQAQVVLRGEYKHIHTDHIPEHGRSLNHFFT